MSGPIRRADELRPGHRVYRGGKVGTVVTANHVPPRGWNIEVTVMPMHQKDTLHPHTFTVGWDEWLEMDYID